MHVCLYGSFHFPVCLTNEFCENQLLLALTCILKPYETFDGKLCVGLQWTYLLIRVFHSLYKVGRNGNFVFKVFNNSKKKLPPVGLDLMLQIITGLGVQCLTI